MAVENIMNKYNRERDSIIYSFFIYFRKFLSFDRVHLHEKKSAIRLFTLV